MEWLAWRSLVGGQQAEHEEIRENVVNFLEKSMENSKCKQILKKKKFSSNLDKTIQIGEFLLVYLNFT